MQVERAAEDQHGGHRQGVAGVAEREEDVAQPQGVALGGVGGGDGLVDQVHPAGGQPQRLDGAGALHGLGQALGEPGVGGRLPQVALVRPAQVPAGGAVEHRHREQAGQQQEGADQHQGAEGEADDADRGHGGRDRGADGAGQLVDVAGGASDQVAGVGVLHRLRRQSQQVGDELLAQVGQDLLAEPGRRVLGEPDQHGLGGQAAEDEQHQAQHGVLAVGDVGDQGAEQPGGEQPGDGGERLQADHQGELAAVGEEGTPRVRGEFTVRSDRQLTHAAAVQRSTSSR